MTAEEKTIRIPANLNDVATACNFVAGIAVATGMSEKQVHQCQLAVDEACTNIIEHGYQSANENQFIDVACLPLKDRLIIRVSDDSPPYNPLQRNDPQPGVLLEDRNHGGWGVFFIKQTMDKVTYAYKNKRNQLEMTKYIAAQPDDQPNKLNVTTKNYPKNILVVGFHDKIGDDNKQKIERVLDDYLHEGHRYLILDMQSVPAVSTNGWQMLVAIEQRARSQRGDLALAGLTPPVYEVIKLTGLDMVFTVTASVDDALKYYQSRK